MLCYHTNVEQFEGTLDFVPGPNAQLNAKGTFYNADADKPIQVSVELPQFRHVPLWLQALAAVSPFCLADWTKPRVTLQSLQCFNFDLWQVSIPFVGTLNLQDLCGYLPVHVVVHQGNIEFLRIIVQRRRFCTQLRHDASIGTITIEAPAPPLCASRFAHVRA